MNEMHDTKSVRRFAGLVVVAVIGLMIPGSASTAGPDSAVNQDVSDERIAGSLDALFEAALARPNVSTAERATLEQALATGSISPGDYESAHQRYTSCMTSAGFTPTFRVSSYGYYIELPYHNVRDVDALDDAVAECSSGSSIVESLYLVQQFNPKLSTDAGQLAVDCLSDAGLVNDSYSSAAFEADMKTREFPFDPYAAAANDCLWGAGYGFFDSESGRQ